MVQEPWNKINIPFPGAVSSSRILFIDSTDILIESLLTNCEKVLTLLCSECACYIHAYYHRLSSLHHLQVEQCVNYLKEIKLQAAMEDLKELCPNKFQMLMIEEQSMAVILHTPVRLTRQHLLLGEFIVLNVVITSMLSPLIPMYKRTTELIQKVSQSQPMAYLTDFTLPGDLKDFLCLAHPDLLLEEGTKDPLRAEKGTRKSNISLLSRLFGDRGHEENNGKEECYVIIFTRCHSPDVSSYGLDMKVVLQQSCKTTKQVIDLDFSSKAAVIQKMKFLKSLKKVSSFRNMAAHLKEIMHWCRSCKFHQEHTHLAFLNLKCLRMECLEAEGKRLKKFKLKVQKALMFQKIQFLHYADLHFPGCVLDQLNTFSLKHGTCRPQQQSSKEEVSGNKKVLGAEVKIDSQTALQKPNVLNDDTDDIFASFEFYGVHSVFFFFFDNLGTKTDHIKKIELNEIMYCIHCDFFPAQFEFCTEMFNFGLKNDMLFPSDLC
uniref:Nucleolus and neural progenitor protein n=1 Tax=Sinocyclocheilus grahami TaxID=75366 RepID=A0A672KQR6_SINGR